MSKTIFTPDPMQRLSKDFRLSEFLKSQTAERRGIDNTPSELVVDNLARLCANVLQPVRDRFGPVVVSSGYRSPALNAAVGGSPTSQHLQGEAADIEVPGVTNYALAKWIAESLSFDQLILEFYTPGKFASGWVHISYRQGRLRHDVKTIGPGISQDGLKA